MCEDRELQPVYISFVRTGQDELCVYDELLLPEHKDRGSHAPV